MRLHLTFLVCIQTKSGRHAYFFWNRANLELFYAFPNNYFNHCNWRHWDWNTWIVVISYMDGINSSPLQLQNSCECAWNYLNLIWISCRKPQHIYQSSRCSFSVLLGWANAIKMPDQHKYFKKGIFASYKMFRKDIEILILSFNYLKLSIS